MRLGGRNFKITAVLEQEPDRMTAGAGMGPRIMISQAAMARTGLLAPGSRASQRLLVQAARQAADRHGRRGGNRYHAVRKQLEAVLPDAQVIDYREGNPALTQGLDNATSILSLICLVAMVLGAIGVAMAMHAHLEQRMDMLAILKAIGATSSDLLRIFLLQTLGLGLAGGLLGVAAGAGVMVALPAVFGKLLPIHTTLAFPWRSALAGLGTGLLTTILFCLPPLLDVRAVRPVLVLRRLVEEGPRSIGDWFALWWSRRLQLGIAALLIVALGAIALGALRFARRGNVVRLAICRCARWFYSRSPRWLCGHCDCSSIASACIARSLRHGLANLYRPGNQSAAVLAALGTGVMLILAVYLMQAALLRDLRETAAPNLPNVFLVDINTDEIAGIKNVLRAPNRRESVARFVAGGYGPFISINGQPIEQMKGQHFPRRMLESAALSWADTPPPGDKVTAGKWWTDPNATEIAVGNGVAERLHLGVGSAG